MSLVGFHRALILTAIVFCFLFAGWELRAWFDQGRTLDLALAATFALLGAGLAFYLARLARFLNLEDR